MALAVMIATPGVWAAQATDSTPPQPEQTLLKPEQVDALVAPIALYPDALLANLLAASTFPLEAMWADRWLDDHKKMKGDALKTEFDRQGRDDSVKALASTPCTSGKKDGLYWRASDGDASPLGEFVAQASQRGPNAPGGALNYVVKGQMMGGLP